MKFEERVVDEKLGIVQITTQDERFYKKDGVYLPSITWITSYYPKDSRFAQFLKDNGEESDTIRDEAGNKGTRVHEAINRLVNGHDLHIRDKYPNRYGVDDELTADEWECVMSFWVWWQVTQPKLLGSEYVVFNKKYGYAGSVDLKLEMDGEPWIVDIKTSKSVYTSHKIQVSAYAKAEKVKKMGILQVGYKLNKNRYKFTEVEDMFDIFLATKKIWASENDGKQPLQREFPITLTLRKEKK